jgi:hypothetical protein
MEGIYLVRKIAYKALIFDEKVFDFLGQDLESKNTEQAAKKNEPSEYASSLPYDEDNNQDS